MNCCYRNLWHRLELWQGQGHARQKRNRPCPKLKSIPMFCCSIRDAQMLQVLQVLECVVCYKRPSVTADFLVIVQCRTPSLSPQFRALSLVGSGFRTTAYPYLSLCCYSAFPRRRLQRPQPRIQWCQHGGYSIAHLRLQPYDSWNCSVYPRHSGPG